MQFKIKTLLLSVMIFIVAVPLLIILVVYNTGIRSLFESRSESYSYEIIKQAGENISTLIEQAHFTEKRLISSVRTSQILLEYSNAVPMQKLGVISDIERMIWDYKQSANYISDIYLFGDDNRLFSTTTSTDLEMLKNAPWIAPLLEQGEQIKVTATHKAYYDVPDSRLTATQRDKHVISFIQKVYLLGLENKYSIVQMDIKYSEIEKIMKRVDLGSDGLAVIVDADNNIIYCEKKEYLGAPLSSYMGIHDDANWGKDLAWTEYSLGSIPWRVIGLVSTEMIAAEFGQINRVLLMAIFVSTIISGLLITIICRQITQPITLLGKRMNEVGSGNFNTINSKSLCKEFYDLTEQFNHMVDEIDDLMYMVQRQEQEKAAAEFKALQNQISPHFLYNTLNTIKWMALVDENTKIAHATVSLVKMLKFTCQDTNNMIPLETEIQFLEDYIAIQKLRYGNDISVHFRIDPVLYRYHILKFILQPILENSFVHGFPDNKSDQEIIVSGCLEEDMILFAIQDNGVGIRPQHGDRFTGLGIKNVEQRIQQHYGKRFGITMRSVLHEGTTVLIRLPLIEDDAIKDKEDEENVPGAFGG